MSRMNFQRDLGDRSLSNCGESQVSRKSETVKWHVLEEAKEDTLPTSGLQ